MVIKRFLSSASKPLIHITDRAWTQISCILMKTQSPAFLFSANGGGCNGFNYDFQIVSDNQYQSWMNNKIIPNTLKLESSTIIIDPMSELLLLGTTIDFVSNIYENKFTFTPDKNLATSCGCGVSFSPRK